MYFKELDRHLLNIHAALIEHSSWPFTANIRSDPALQLLVASKRGLVKMHGLGNKVIDC